MAVDVVLPRLGMTMDDAEIVEWLKQEGDHVENGEPILVVTTDKANIEVEAEASGTLAGISAHVGDVVLVGQTVAHILEEGESLVEARASIKTPAQVEPAVSSPAPVKASPVARRMAAEQGVDLGSLEGSGPGGRIVKADIAAAAQATGERDVRWVKASPYARLLARQAGISLQGVTPSHYTGRVVARDVERFETGVFPESPVSQSPIPTLEPVSPILPPMRVTEVTPLSGIRATIARRMAASARATARAMLMMEVDAAVLVEARQRLGQQVAEAWGFVPSYNDWLIKATAVALREHPALNARLNGDRIELLREINVGLAVDTQRGLLVPVVRNADQLGLRAIGTALRELVERARSGAATLEDLSGGTFTITNLGMYDVDAFAPVINLPEAAILGAGRIREHVVPVEGEAVIRPTMWLTLTFDHRLVDGAPAARFLQRVKALIEEPLLLLG